MYAKRKQDIRAAQILQGQLRLLRQGSRATDFACREMLGVDMGAGCGEILTKVHAALHVAEEQDTKESVENALGHMTAAVQLLKYMVAEM